MILEFPEGRTIGNEKCFGLDAYKNLAIIYTRYSVCETQRALVADLRSAVDEKQGALEEATDDLSYALSLVEEERDSYIVAATTNAEQAELEARYKRVWRGFAIGGLVVSLALGAVILGVGVSR